MAMMDDLVRQISERAGIPADKAQMAARAAVEFLDGRLPPPVGGQLGKLVEGGAGGAGGGGGIPDLGKMAGGLGGMFGGGK